MSTTKRYVSSLLATIAILVSSGCFDTKQSYEINPDGSGRVTFETVYQSMNLAMTGDASTPEFRAKREAREIVEESFGVEAWENVRFEALPDGKVKIAGTAYFRDLNRFKLHNIALQALRYEKLADGSLRLSTQRTEGNGKLKPAKTDPATMDFATESAKYKQARPMLESFLGSMRDELSFAPPGEADKTSTIGVGTSGMYTVLFDGKAILKATDEVMTDESRFKALVAQGGSLDPAQANNPAFEQLMRGGAEPGFLIVRPPLRTVFDYAANAKRARENRAALMESLGAPSFLEPDGTNTIAFTRIAVSGIKLERPVESRDTPRPMSTSETKTPYQLSLVASLPGAVSEVDQGKLLSATSTSGEDLMPDDEYRRKISFPRLDNDRTSVRFDIQLKRPASLSDGLREVAGEVTVLMQRATETVDLGFPALTNGAVGSVYDATLQIEDSGSKVGDKTLVVRFQINSKLLEGVEVLDKNGNPIKPSTTSSSAMNDTRTMKFSGPPWPVDARIVARVRKDVVRQAVPFKVEDISLLGEPLAP